MKSPALMTRAELERAMLIAGKKAMVICEAMIAAGRGYEKPSETRTKTDPLSIARNVAADWEAALYAERERRLTYHGKLTPIHVKTS